MKPTNLKEKSSTNIAMKLKILTMRYIHFSKVPISDQEPLSNPIISELSIDLSFKISVRFPSLLAAGIAFLKKFKFQNKHQRRNKNH